MMDTPEIEWWAGRTGYIPKTGIMVASIRQIDEGWEWEATAHERGRWVKAGPFPTAEAAKADLLAKWTYNWRAEWAGS